MIRASLLALGLLATPALAETMVVQAVDVTEWKSVYATVEARRTVPARARIGGTISELEVTEGDTVQAGVPIGLVEDDKLAYQLAAIDAQIEAAEAQLENAQAELARGEALVEKGVSTAQRLDALRTQVDVVNGQLLSLRADRDRVTQTQAEGSVLAPADGIVLSVPVATGEVIMPGEPIATVGSGGFFLRLQVPERYADSLHEGDSIVIGDGADAATGRLAKVYPLIAGGRVQADIEVAGLDPRFTGARVAVRLAVGQRSTLAVPAEALSHREGLDFLTVEGADGPIERVVVPGGPVDAGGQPLVEIVSGLRSGDVLVLNDE
ncbi:efflux RND transporter periplasmic adaptor subunit [Frigidibacter sp. ROC022]|uniref:efflux RND transporter periplasmic adaptor subunit n=1 Tax=Frigidibacter sp. ROC022 TaxID=2971796 RepID=UPI00215A68E1|nr:efflux RND transporter periplasmic adaptor subunit [Frigidibacter sp. ROC022]MCR8725530.1 efflux RND transporter periplasmic adaptor subunit [Frigidibacter sp. ROC022]